MKEGAGNPEAKLNLTLPLWVLKRISTQRAVAGEAGARFGTVSFRAGLPRVLRFSLQSNFNPQPQKAEPNGEGEGGSRLKLSAVVNWLNNYVLIAGEANFARFICCAAVARER